MAFKRGFKSWCETVAAKQRRELGLGTSDALDPRALAKQMGITILNAEEVPEVPAETLKILLKQDPDSWSALTLSLNNHHLVVLNSAHSAGRISSDLMHELSHLLIGHKSARIDFTEDNLLMLRYCDGDQEDEANWLAGCLLLPREALLKIKRQGLSHETAARQYHVSSAMLTYRLRITGVEAQTKRTAGARA